MDGWRGQLVRINLTKGSSKIEPISEKILKDYLGGRGLAVRIYTQEVDGDIDPLDKKNKVVIAAGGLCGTATPCASIASIVTKSPVTNTIVCGRMQGYFGTELKFCGLDAIVIEGKAEYPVVVFITDSSVSIRPALQYWGRTTKETQRLIKAELKDRWAARESFIACIGPAGEKGVSLATLVNEDYLVTGGVGIGRVLGAKNLKAIVVKGTQDVTVSNGQKCLQAIFSLKNRFNASPFTREKLPKYGNAFLLDACLKRGVLPINNFKGIAKELNGIDENNIERITHRRACFSCPIGCVRTVREKDREIVGLDYETVASFGYLCGIDDLDDISEIRFLCTEFGLDILNTASSIACAMELYEEGALKDMELPFGSKNIISLLKQIGKNKGLGKEVGKGGSIFANSLNRPHIFMGVKGNAIPPFDPRGLWGLGLHMATSNFGAYHLNGLTVIEELFNIHEKVEPFLVEEKPEFVKKIQDMTASLDALGICINALFALKVNNILPIFDFVFGYKIDIEELLLVGERIWNLERLFNLKAGLCQSDDSLPKRLIEEPLNGYTCPLGEMLPIYYKERGWDKEGKPKKETLERLGLCKG